MYEGYPNQSLCFSFTWNNFEDCCFLGSEKTQACMITSGPGHKVVGNATGKVCMDAA